MVDNSKNTVPLSFSVTEFSRRPSGEVHIGPATIGGTHSVAVQSMTDCDTNDTSACVAQIGRIREAGGRIVRLTAQGVREAENLRSIAAEVRRRWPDVALVADIHFLPQAAFTAAEYVDKVRINPGNFNRGSDGAGFPALLEKCASRGVALRIGVNHGSLSERIVAEYGDTPRGMVASAMEFLRECRSQGFDQVVVSMKSSNTRVMVHAYRLLVASMAREGMDFPIHLGVTEAGNGTEGRIKSAVGIGALLSDGIGDTLRVSLTEAPENEIPVASALVEYFAARESGRPHVGADPVASGPSMNIPFDPYEYSRRKTSAVGRLGGDNLPLLYSELDEGESRAVGEGAIAVLTAVSSNPVGEWRRMIMEMDAAGDRRPVILHRRYAESSAEALTIKTAADFGVMFIDGLADGIYIENEPLCGISLGDMDAISLGILQAARARMSKADYIACPGCGRTLFDLRGVLDEIKSRTSHLKGLKIAVMGCIVNGPGEMTDADYGYVGAAPGRVTLYRGKEPVRRNIPQGEALDALMELLKTDGIE